MNLRSDISDAVLPALLLLYLSDARCQSGWPAYEPDRFQSLSAGLHPDLDCIGCQAYGPLLTSHGTLARYYQHRGSSPLSFCANAGVTVIIKMAANAVIIVLFFINFPNSRYKISDNSAIITIFVLSFKCY